MRHLRSCETPSHHWRPADVSRALTPHFARFGLTAAFREDRRVDLLRKDFAVTVVEDDYAALTGCAVFLNNAF